MVPNSTFQVILKKMCYFKFQIIIKEGYTELIERAVNILHSFWFA